MILETIKVKTADTESGFMIINKSDFDPAVHEAFAATVLAKLPNIKDLPEHLATLTDLDAVRAMAASDDRSSAAPLYEARIAALTVGA